MDGRGPKKVVSASILDLGEVIESDHAAIRVEIEWKGVMGSGITVNDEQEVERFWGHLFFTNGKVTLGQKKGNDWKGYDK